MTYDLPPSVRRKPQPPRYRCDTCGSRTCGVKGSVVTWTRCPDWTPDPRLFDVKKKEALP